MVKLARCLLPGFPHFMLHRDVKPAACIDSGAPGVCFRACGSNVITLPRQHHVCGSGPAQVGAPDGASPYVLGGHQGEVTAVAWCPTDFEQVRLLAHMDGTDCTQAVWLPSS
jgi:hypothetical protein